MDGWTDGRDGSAVDSDNGAPVWRRRAGQDQAAPCVPAPEYRFSHIFLPQRESRRADALLARGNLSGPVSIYAASGFRWSRPDFRRESRPGFRLWHRDERPQSIRTSGLARSFSSGPAGRRRSTDKKPLTHSAGRHVSASGRKGFRLAARSRRRSSGRGLQQARRACAAAMAGSAGQARPPTDPWPMTSTSRRLARACLCVLVRACAQAGRRRRAVWPVNCNLSPACGWLENRIILAAPTQKPVFSRSQRGQVHRARSDLSGYLVSIFPLICRL